jgi:hypothetical protein
VRPADGTIDDGLAKWLLVAWRCSSHGQSTWSVALTAHSLVMEQHMDQCSFKNYSRFPLTHAQTVVASTLVVDHVPMDACANRRSSALPPRVLSNVPDTAWNCVGAAPRAAPPVALREARADRHAGRSLRGTPSRLAKVSHVGISIVGNGRCAVPPVRRCTLSSRPPITSLVACGRMPPRSMGGSVVGWSPCPDRMHATVGTGHSLARCFTARREARA